MKKTMKADEFAKKLISIATQYDTLYVFGAFGAHLRADNAERYIKKSKKNQVPEVEKTIRESVDKGVFIFDCVCLIKALLWGWNGNLEANYGGAIYESNGVPDISSNQMITVCTEVSEDFSNIQVGEFLWLTGHCGIYVGDGLCVECTPKWENKVQITAVGNIGSKEGYHTRYWTKHGFLPYIDYTTAISPKEPVEEKNDSDSTDSNENSTLPNVQDAPENDAIEKDESHNTLKCLINIIHKLIKLIHSLFTK